MKFLLISLAIISATTSFADNQSFIETTTGQIICSERCQIWDSFTNRCSYRTTCKIEDNLATYNECQNWDSFNNRCGNEKVVRQYLAFDPNSGSPSCTESCQIQDGFGGCSYRKTCSIQPHCASIKYCEQWNNFNRSCKSERIDTACHLKY